LSAITLVALQSESKQTSFTALSIAWSPGLAWLVNYVFYQGARALGY
jgi:ferrous iron transport protein B